MPMLASWPCQAFRRPRPILEEHTNYSQHPVQSTYTRPAIIPIYSLTTAQPPPKNNQNNVDDKKTHYIPPNQQKRQKTGPSHKNHPKNPKTIPYHQQTPLPTLPSQPPDLAPAHHRAQPAQPLPDPFPPKNRGPKPARGSGSPFWSPNFQIWKTEFSRCGTPKKASVLRKNLGEFFTRVFAPFPFREGFRAQIFPQKSPLAGCADALRR